MRNLKRALSLTLASVMLLGMMVVGTSAASFPDVTAEDNVEAIEVLAAVKVLQGYDDGQYHADTPVTRNQMATIICRMMGWRDGDFAGLNPFPDVPAWASNYVAACVANGIINGRDDGRFHGDDTVTATEAASMMLRALGYTRMPVGADWARAVAQQASKINLFDELDVGAYTALTRGDVSQLALNTLESAMVEVEDNTLSIEAGNGVTVSGGQINYVVVTSSKDYAKSISRAESSGNALNGVNGPIVELGEHVFNGDLKKVASIDAFGAPSTRWTYKNVEVGNYAETEDYKFEGTVKSNAMYAAVGKNAAEKYQWTVTMDGTDIDVKAASDKQALFTGSDVADNDRDDLAGTHNGTVTYVYLDDTAVTDKNDRVIYNGTATVCIVNTYAAEVIKVSGSTITLDDMDKSGLEFDSTGYAEGDIVLYTKTVNHDGGNSKIQNILGKAELVEGKADEVRESATAGDRVTIGDKNYSYSHRFNGDNGGKLTIASAGENVAFYLDRQGKIIRMGDVEESNDYAYVYDVGRTTSGYSNDTDFGATLIMTDGTKKKVDLDSDTTKGLAPDKNAATLRTALQGHIVSYTVEDNGNYNLDIKSTHKITWNAAHDNLLKEGLSRLDSSDQTTFETWAFTPATNDDSNAGSWSAASAVTLYANKNSAILVNESVEDNDKFNVYNGYEALPNVNSVATSGSQGAGNLVLTTAVVYVDKGGVIRAMFVTDAEIAGSSKDAIFIIGQGSSPKVYDNGSNEYHVYDVVQDGKIDSIRVKNGSDADTKLCNLADKQVGIFFKIKTNSNNFVTDVDATLPTDIAVNGIGKNSQSGDQLKGDWSGDKYTGVGRVDGELRFNYNPNTDRWGVRPGSDKDALVVYYTEANELSLEGIHTDRNDDAYVITDDGKIIAIFVKEIKDGTTDNNNTQTNIPGLNVVISTTQSGMSGDERTVTKVEKKAGTTVTTDDVLNSIKTQAAAWGWEFYNESFSSTTYTLEFRKPGNANARYYVKWNSTTEAIKSVVSAATPEAVIEQMNDNTVDIVVVDSDASVTAAQINGKTEVRVSKDKKLTISDNGALSKNITGDGTVVMDGRTITGGDKIEAKGGIETKGTTSIDKVGAIPVKVTAGATTIGGAVDAKTTVNVAGGAGVVLTNPVELPTVTGTGTVTLNGNVAADKADMDQLVEKLGDNSTTVSGENTVTMPRTTVKLDKASTGSLGSFSSAALNTIVTNANHTNAGMYKITLKNVPVGTVACEATITAADGSTSTATPFATQTFATAGDQDFVLLLGDRVTKLDFTVTPTSGTAYHVIVNIGA